jgi:type II pantothenate kinase
MVAQYFDRSANCKNENHMPNTLNATIIGIDRGASCTDFAVLQSDVLMEIFSIAGRDWESIRTVYERLISKYQTRHIVFSGSAAGMPAAMKKAITIIAEIDAIGFGGAALADCSECVVVSMGTGSAVVHFANNNTAHLGGSGIGGGTIKGLSTLICGLDNPSQIEALALEGDAAKLNLTISDLGYEQISFLGADMTASNFADLKSQKVEDQAAAILDLVGETVGIIASICARSVNCRDRIVMVGKVAQNQFIRQVLNLVGKLYQTTFIFPENPGYATVYGATVKYRYDMTKKTNTQ